MKIVTFFFIALFAFVACNQNECTTSNNIFEQAPFNSTIYNIQLARSINVSDSSKVKYVFQSLEQVGEDNFMNLLVTTTDGCIKGRFLIEEIAALQKLIDNKGKGYKGAELKGFSFTMNGEVEPMVLVCTNLIEIVD